MVIIRIHVIVAMITLIWYKTLQILQLVVVNVNKVIILTILLIVHKNLVLFAFLVMNHAKHALIITVVLLVQGISFLFLRIICNFNDPVFNRPYSLFNSLKP